MICRKDMLESVLNAAFGRTTISLSEGCIKYVGDWYSRCSFSQLDYSRYCNLFQAVLLSDVSIEKAADKHAGIISEADMKFSKELRLKAVEGLKCFFERYGCYFTFSDNLAGRRWLEETMRNHVLPIILLSSSSSGIREKEKEDIEEEFFETLEKIHYSTGFVLSNIPQTEIVEITNERYQTDECNYEMILHSCARAWNNIIENYRKIIYDVDCLLLYQTTEEKSDEECRRLFLNWGNHDCEPDNPDLPTICSNNDENTLYHLKVKLTLFTLNENLIGNIRCRYRTRLDGRSLLEYKGLSSYQIAEEIQNEGETAFYNLISGKGANGKYRLYCNQGFCVINDLLKRMNSVELIWLISGEKINDNRSKTRKLTRSCLKNKKNCITLTKSLWKQGKQRKEK